MNSNNNNEISNDSPTLAERNVVRKLLAGDPFGRPLYIVLVLAGDVNSSTKTATATTTASSTMT